MFKFYLSLCVVFFVFMCDAATDSCGKNIVVRRMSVAIKGWGFGNSNATGADQCLRRLKVNCKNGGSAQFANDGVSCYCGYALGPEISADVTQWASSTFQTFFNSIINDGFTQNTVTLETGINTRKGLGLVVSCSGNGQDEAWVRDAINKWSAGKTLSGATSQINKSYDEWYTA